MLGVAFHAGADAAPERVEPGRIDALRSRIERHEIDEQAGVGVLLRHDVIEVGALVIIEPFRVRRPLVQMPRQLEHVVAVAAFAGLVGDVGRNHVGGAEMLGVGIAADHIGMVMHDRVPEEGRRIAITGVAGQFIKPRQPAQLGDLGVGVLARQFVAPLRQRQQNRLVIKAFAHGEEARLAGAGIGLGEGLVQPAVLAGQHLLHLVVAQAPQHADQVVGHLHRDVERFGVIGIKMGVEQALMHLMPGVERHPAAVQVEAVAADPVRAHLLEDDLAVHRLAVALHRRAADIAVAVRDLTGGQFVEHVVYAPAEAFIARLGQHQRTGGHIVAEAVTGDAHRLPAAIDRALRRKARARAEIVQQTVGFEFQQVLRVAVHRPLPERVLQRHRRQRKRRDLRRRLVGDGGEQVFRDQAEAGPRHQNLSARRLGHDPLQL